MCLLVEIAAHDIYQDKKFLPDKVIAAMSKTLNNVCLIILGADHDDRHDSIWDCLAQLQAELMSCTSSSCVCWAWKVYIAARVGSFTAMAARPWPCLSIAIAAHMNDMFGQS